MADLGDVQFAGLDEVEGLLIQVVECVLPGAAFKPNRASQGRAQGFITGVALTFTTRVAHNKISAPTYY